MENEKRMVGDYTVLCAVNIGSREIILAENEQSANGERFLCCYGERNDIFEKFSECAVGDDYIDAALFFAERIKKDAEQFRAEVEKLANARGSAVFCRNLYDGKDTRYERMDVLGEVKPERMPDWAKEKAAAISRKHKTKGQER